jgi:Pyruvate/2-oxoacid:ferredoxin oxidoreductase gamma subunit
MDSTRAGRQVYCVITDKYGNSVKTNTVTLGMAVKITTQPTSVKVANGSTAKVTVKASGDGLTYKWYFKDKGATAFKHTATFTGNSYYTQMNADRAGRQIYCVVTDKYGNSAKTNTVTLGMKATITTQPKSIVVPNGYNFTVSFKAVGDGLTYKWYFKDKGATAFKHTAAFAGNSYYTQMSPDRAGRQIYCVVTDKYGNSIKTNTVILGMKATITKNPNSTAVKKGVRANFKIAAVGDGLSYQWQVKTPSATTWKSVTITGYKTNTITVEATAARNGYQYRCAVTDQYGNKVYSAAAKLTVK